MQYIVDLGVDKLRLYYNQKVYSPEYSSLDTIFICDKLIKDGKNPFITVMDYGCGTGLLGLGVKKLHPTIKLVLCDTDPEARRVARLNAKRNGLSVSFSEGLTGDIILANLPTFADEDMHLAIHGPKIAYYAKEPLMLYENLFLTAQSKAIVAECQKKYQEEFLKLAKKNGWKLALSTEMSFGFIR